MMIRQPILSVSTLLAAILIVGCSGGEHHGPGSGHAGVRETIAMHESDTQHARAMTDRWTDRIARRPVAGLDLAGRDTFYVADRTPDIGRFPCGVCHTVPVATMRSTDTTRRRAHWEISIDHAAETTMDCMTCHAGGDMQSVQLLGGEVVDLDESYRVCSQCHSTQAREWVGGAHGKRLGGWAGERVVANCAACHNPHRPALESRLPARTARLEEVENANREEER